MHRTIVYLLWERREGGEREEGERKEGGEAEEREEEVAVVTLVACHFCVLCIPPGPIVYLLREREGGEERGRREGGEREERGRRGRGEGGEGGERGGERRERRERGGRR
jgi:hypothetical protein